MAIHSSILAWRIPWREEPGGGLQSTESQRVGHDGATSLTHSLIYQCLTVITEQTTQWKAESKLPKLMVMHHPLIW